MQPTRSTFAAASRTLGAALLTASLAIAAAPGAAQAQNLGDVFRALGGVAAESANRPRRLSDGEIRERALIRGANQFLSGNPSPRGALGSYEAYLNERDRLEERNRRLRGEQIGRILGGLGGVADALDR